VLRGIGFAAATSASLLAGPSFAAPEAPTSQASSGPIAQGYGTPVAAEVIEVVQGTGFYLTIGAGAAWPSDVDTHVGTDDINVNPVLHFGGGFSGEAGIGYDFGALRTELTYGYTRADLNDVSLPGFDIGSSGAINKNDVMASLYWDISTGTRWVPYIGGGIGYTNLSTPSVKIGDYRTGSANRGLFGWQAKVGVSYVTSVNTDVFLEGTYSGAQGFDDNDVNYASYNDFGAKLGFRYRFVAPVAEVVVVPEPAPQPMPEPAPMPQPQPEPAPAPAPIRGLW
jgi:opacity protein-like surface antigen